VLGAVTTPAAAGKVTGVGGRRRVHHSPKATPMAPRPRQITTSLAMPPIPGSDVTSTTAKEPAARRANSCHRLCAQPRATSRARARPTTKSTRNDAETTSANVVTNRSRIPSQIAMPANASRVNDAKTMATRIISRITAMNWMR
jgi:hypothetical protein